MRRFFFIAIPFLILTACATRQTEKDVAFLRAGSIPISKYCPDFGVLELGSMVRLKSSFNDAVFPKGNFRDTSFSRSDWQNEAGARFITLKSKDGKFLDLPVEEATGALKINSVEKLNSFLRDYKALCGIDQPTFYESIAFVAQKKRAAFKASMKSGVLGGLKEGEYVDFSVVEKLFHSHTGGTLPQSDPLVQSIMRFHLAWLNDRENPGIESIKYPGDEFQFQEDSKRYKQLRQVTKVLTDQMNFGEYNFEKMCLPFEEEDVSDLFSKIKPDKRANLPTVNADTGCDINCSMGISPLELPRVLQMFSWRSAKEYKSQFKKNDCIQMPPEVARVLKAQAPKDRLLFLIFSIQPKTIQPFACPKDLADISFRDYEEVEKCKREKWDLRRVKIFELELVRYAIEVSGQVFKNF